MAQLHQCETMSIMGTYNFQKQKYSPIVYLSVCPKFEPPLDSDSRGLCRPWMCIVNSVCLSFHGQKNKSIVYLSVCPNSNHPWILIPGGCADPGCAWSILSVCLSTDKKISQLCICLSVQNSNPLGMHDLSVFPETETFQCKGTLLPFPERAHLPILLSM
jgi:hypothetical protein